MSCSNGTRYESSSVETIKHSYDQVFAKSKEVFSLIAPKGYLEKPIQLRHPFIFYVGHVAGFASIQVNQKALKKPPFAPAYDSIFERGLDPDVLDPSRCHDHSRIPTQWPTLAQIDEYVEKCHGEIFTNLDEVQKQNDSLSKWARDGRIHWLAIEHEMMHQETLMYMYLEMDSTFKSPPPTSQRAFLRSTSSSGGRDAKVIAIPAGKVQVGAHFDAIPFGWDNEFPAHDVDLPAFEVDDIPVTNEKFCEFVRCGAYEDKANWSEESWSWKTRTGRKHPQAWKQMDGDYYVKTLFNEDVSLKDFAGAWPAFVSFSEAQAYARWKGRRLMSEAEWCRAAYTSPSNDERKYPWGNEEPTKEHGNFNWANWAPTPAGSHPLGKSAWGVDDLIGDAWEWTSTPFAPYEGFEAMETYPGYSADFFVDENDYECAHYVLKGASFATAAQLVRPSFRNWFQGCYPYVWAKFRLANDL